MSSSQYPYHAPPTSSSDVHPTQNNGNIPCQCHCGRINYFPAGYRFIPEDSELIVHYLKNRVKNQPFPLHATMSRKITDVDLYKCSPDELTAGRKLERGEKYWYFITARDRKYKNGSRPNRTAGAGFWKATGSDKPVEFEGKLLGHKKTLKYYRGKTPRNGTPTNWIMHEFTLPDESDERPAGDNMKLKGLVLCKIYKKLDKKKEDDDEGDHQTAAYDNEDPQTNSRSSASTTTSDPQTNGESPASTTASIIISNEDINSWNFPPVHQPNNVDFSISDFINWDFLYDVETNNLDFMAAAGSLDLQHQQEEMKLHQVPSMSIGQNQDSGASS